MELSEDALKVVDDITGIFDEYNLDSDQRAFLETSIIRAYHPELGEDIRKLFDDIKLKGELREMIAGIAIIAYVEGRISEKSPDAIPVEVREEAAYGLAINRVSKKYRIEEPVQ